MPLPLPRDAEPLRVNIPIGAEGSRSLVTVLNKTARHASTRVGKSRKAEALQVRVQLTQPGNGPSSAGGQGKNPLVTARPKHGAEPGINLQMKLARMPPEAVGGHVPKVRMDIVEGHDNNVKSNREGPLSCHSTAPGARGASIREPWPEHRHIGDGQRENKGVSEAERPRSRTQKEDWRNLAKEVLEEHMSLGKAEALVVVVWDRSAGGFIRPSS